MIFCSYVTNYLDLDKANIMKYTVLSSKDTKMRVHPIGFLSDLNGIKVYSWDQVVSDLHFGDLLAYVTIPADAMATDYATYTVTDQVVTGMIAPIADLSGWSDPNFCLAVVGQNGLALQYVKNQTRAICAAAVNQNAIALKYVKNQTRRICMMAIRKTFTALQYVRDQTDTICLDAVSLNGYALRYVRDQIDAICLAAVKQNGYALQYVKNPTLDVCLAAVKQNKKLLYYVRNHNPAIYSSLVCL